MEGWRPNGLYVYRRLMLNFKGRYRRSGFTAVDVEGTPIPNPRYHYVPVNGHD
jgi:hypothetical protein